MTEHEQLLEKRIEDCTADSARRFFSKTNIHFKRKDEELENFDSKEIEKSTRP